MVDRNVLQPCSGVIRTGDFRSALCYLRNDLAGGVVTPLPQPVALAPDFDDFTYVTQTVVDPNPLLRKKFTLSFWFRIGDADADRWDIISATDRDNTFWDNTFRVTRMDAGNGNVLEIEALNPSLSPVLNVTSSLAYTLTTNPGWHHCVFSADLALGTVKWYIDAQSVSFTINNFVSNQNIAFEVSDGPTDMMTYEIGGGIFVQGEQFRGCLAEVWLAPGVFYELDQLANRRLFINADLKPANLGLDGRAPLNGKAVLDPLIYLRSNFDIFNTNSGSRGDFDLVGIPTACFTNPCVGL